MSIDGMSTTLERTATFRPVAPRRSEETGLPRSFVTNLILKTFYYRNDMQGHEAARAIHLAWSAVEQHIEDLRREKLIEVKGAEGSSLATYRFAITQAGRDRAREALKVSQYVGPAPVTLKDYTDGLLAQTSAREPVDGAILQAGLSHLVLPREVIQQVGPALNAQRSLFLYGSPGNGKTVLAEAIGRALGGALTIPHAVEVDGQVIKVMDPIFHGDPLADLDEASGATKALRLDPPDERWVQVRRPVVFAGGELTLEMLDLNFNAREGFYEAPLQMKSNGGVFIVDDFGRQLVKPRDLLNRWIVPLEKGVDFLALHTGRKFPIPFSAMVIFATNLSPRDLVDEAFLRRIRYKVEMSDPEPDDYAEIFTRECMARGVEPRREAIAYIYRQYYETRGIPVRACHPRDLLDKIVETARWNGVTAELTPETIDLVCRSYFLSE
ncbi:MAG TPA: ATP-binding protein [Candidatus Polarisedimenticolia bacterium]|nr:ATP-binding protein [Candidatus Polarisedimenticolia bacterium]